MKGKMVLAFGVMLFFGIVFAGCGKGTANGTGEPDTEKLLGTWVDEADGTTMVFNSDGTVSDGEGTSFKYGTAGGKMAFVVTQGTRTVTSVMDFQLSSDGKILILSWGSANVTSDNGSLLRKIE
jgi:hypothetical protein